MAPAWLPKFATLVLTVLYILKPISVPFNQIQRSSRFNADAVEFWKELAEILKRELCNDKIIKLQVFKNHVGIKTTISSSFSCKYSQNSSVLG